VSKVAKPGSDVELARLLFDRMDHCRQLKAKHIRLVRDSGKPMRNLRAAVAREFHQQSAAIPERLQTGLGTPHS